MSAVSGGKPSAMQFRNKPYSGYYKREVPPEDAEITHAGSGTPLGEYMRRFWQPVCLSSQLIDRPLALRVLNEDLVAFRDGRGRVGLLHRHCCHRGASLEYGIVQERGIRCCYHGFHFDVDGTLLEVPAERDKGARLKQTISQGAYPTLERDGLIFAYMGPHGHRATVSRVRCLREAGRHPIGSLQQRLSLQLAASDRQHRRSGAHQLSS